MESEITREEQIKQAEIAYSNNTLFDGCDFIGEVAKQEAFIAGAKWADKTMIDKACEWLSNNKDNYIIDIEGETLIDDQIIKNFRKAMEK